ncbi:glycosyl transferase, putative [Perkinsus marinus ATCC 50983]|uniref:GDP-Man:Man(3)GlcNAc(2)-PP-Dol alpha-1,2-mannosyltransferase n=1 Tax=Perkinsus marinus (strain ATCC 50983 / TXsc) TaxID=423536 RepID=C5KJA2_PERM5|nr:glycosyl transferase, putative [Perkinsus marinus ATCC 50983]EER15404.1 glycosyl transferase, putative [Perkinsus marinus ATCC 50983]|eukprot:XP_002783608.1 glycosyl transferase, putative [Perkinsus marinus ATCC 50983]
MPSRGASLMAFNNSNGVKVLASGDSDDDDWVTEEEEELEKGNRRTARSKGMSSRRKRVKDSRRKQQDGDGDAQKEAEMFIHLMSAMLEAQQDRQQQQSKRMGRVSEVGGGGGSSTTSNNMRSSTDDYPTWDDSFMMDDPFDDDYDPFEDEILFDDDSDEKEEEEGRSPRDLVHWPTMWRLLAGGISFHGHSNDITKAMEGLLIRGELAMQTYQLGSRAAAVNIRDQLLEGFVLLVATLIIVSIHRFPGDSIKEAGMMSDYLFKRFTGTCEVLDMMPQLLGLLKQARDEKKTKGARSGQRDDRVITEVDLGAFLRLALVPLQLGVVLMASLALALLVFVVDTITQRIIVTQEHRNEGSTTIAYFFHPDCASGGGGERVLWAAILGLLRANKEGTIVIYTDEKSSVNRVLRGVSDRFGIRLPSGSSKRIRFVHVRFTRLLRVEPWPTLTVIGQSLGAALVAMTGFVNEKPKRIFVDTVGQAFIFPFVRLACGSDVRIAAYVHYPTMSYDMLARVTSGTAMYNNSSAVASSPLLTKLKSFYYRAFLKVYGFAGRFADVVLTNSTWTDSRIKAIWQVPTTVIYPPADLRRGSGEGPRRGSDLRPNLVVSLSQFRREKNQSLQLETFAKVLARVPSARMTMMGAVRPNVIDDQILLQELKSKAVKLGIEDNVAFKLNAPWPEVLAELNRARVAIHTMKDEHFGIALLEFMSAGCVVVANNSGGPRDDIIGTGTDAVGFLSDDSEDYAASIVEVLTGWSSQKITSLRDKAAKKLDSFNNDAEFGDVFASKLSGIMN